MGLFDSPSHVLIILVVLVVLFGSARLPKAAKSMGEAMRIFKKESAKMHEEDSSTAQVQSWTPEQVAAQQPQVAPQQVTSQQANQEQMAALQQQMDDLKQQMNPAPPWPPAPGTQPGGAAGHSTPTSPDRHGLTDELAAGHSRARVRARLPVPPGQQPRVTPTRGCRSWSTSVSCVISVFCTWNGHPPTVQVVDQ